MAAVAPKRGERYLLPPFGGGSWNGLPPATRFAPRDLDGLEAVASGRLAKALADLGLGSVGRLLEHLPRGWLPLRPLAGGGVGKRVAVAVSVQRATLRKGRSGPFLEASVADRSGVARARFFKQPWLVHRLRPGTALLIEARVVARGLLAVRSFRFLDGRPPALIPRYPAGGGATPFSLGSAIAANLPLLRYLGDPLPPRLRLGLGLPSKGEALASLHAPRRREQLLLARKRLAFEELFLLQLRFLAARRAAASRSAIPLRQGGLARRWLQTLPFQPTEAQLRACAAVDRDLRRGVPMRRLLAGEVGSGKTVVALYALLRAAEAGFQGALLAPTEPLARQHLGTCRRLLGGTGVQAALLTGALSGAAREKTVEGLRTGTIKIVVGTHALLGEGVEFANLAVVVFDEQHRFGVRQRQALLEKGKGRTVPHALYLSATPIPRTLALATYGDLDLTTIRQPPAGRPGVETVVGLAQRLRPTAYQAVRRELAAGRRAFLICPLVEEGEGRAAEAEFRRLAAGELAGYTVGLLHGRMAPADQAAVLERFAQGSLQALVATTVVEVGIDVPEATVVVVEEAERFGLSQLHQLRGRVGRGRERGWCFLLVERPAALPRLQPLAQLRDGFRLAWLDLKERGRGDLVGTRQAGHPQLEVARLPADRSLLVAARRVAAGLLERDPSLVDPCHRPLREAIAARFGGEGRLEG